MFRRAAETTKRLHREAIIFLGAGYSLIFTEIEEWRGKFDSSDDSKSQKSKKSYADYTPLTVTLRARRNVRVHSMSGMKLIADRVNFVAELDYVYAHV